MQARTTPPRRRSRGCVVVVASNGRPSARTQQVTFGAPLSGGETKLRTVALLQTTVSGWPKACLVRLVVCRTSSHPAAAQRRAQGPREADERGERQYDLPCAIGGAE